MADLYLCINGEKVPARVLQHRSDSDRVLVQVEGDSLVLENTWPRMKGPPFWAKAVTRLDSISLRILKLVRRANDVLVGMAEVQLGLDRIQGVYVVLQEQQVSLYYSEAFYQTAYKELELNENEVKHIKVQLRHSYVSEMHRALRMSSTVT